MVRAETRDGSQHVTTLTGMPLKGADLDRYLTPELER